MKFVEFKYLEKTTNYIHGNFDCNRYSTVQYTKMLATIMSMKTQKLAIIVLDLYK